MTPTVQDVLKKMAFQLEAMAATVAALEDAAKSEKYAGVPVSPTEFRELVAAQHAEQRETFEELRGMIGSLDPIE